MIVNGIDIKIVRHNNAIVWMEESGLPMPAPIAVPEGTAPIARVVQITTPASPSPVLTVSVQPTPSVGTKLERAKIIFAANAGATRKAMIVLFISELQMTEAGASTYYATCKRALN